MLLGEDKEQPIQLGEVIGRGGMGIVHKAFQPALNRVVAVKTLNQSAFGADQAATQRFRREAKLAAALNHPNIVATFNVGTDDNQNPYIVMEYLEGRTLADIIAEGALDHERFFELMRQILDGLQYAHEMGLVHRDLKPSNVMVTTSGIAKIMDFGIAKNVNQQHGSKTQALTSTGAMVGSPAYMSPEQCRGDNPDVRSDIYAVGCIMYECLEGRPPFTSDAAFEIFMLHLHEAPPPMEKASDVVEPIVQKALAKDADRRYPSAAELKEALEEAKKKPQIRHGKTAARQMKLPSKPVCLAASAALASAVFGGYLYWKSMPEPPSKAMLVETKRRQATAYADFDKTQPASAQALNQKAYELRKKFVQYPVTQKAIRDPIWKDAKACLDKALQLTEKDPKQAVQLANTFTNYGSWWLTIGYPERAADYFEKALSLRLACSPDNSEQIANDMHSAGCSRQACNTEDSFHYAEKLYLDDLAYRKQSAAGDLDSRHQWYVAIPLRNLASLYYEWDKVDKAAAFAEDAYAKFKMADEHQQVFTHECALVLASVRLKQNRTKEALELAVNAARWAQHDEIDQARVETFDTAVNVMATAYQKMGQQEKSDHFVAISKELREKSMAGEISDIRSIAIE